MKQILYLGHKKCKVPVMLIQGAVCRKTTLDN